MKWHVILVQELPERTRTRIIYTDRRIINQRYKTRRIIEYRVCRGILEAATTALIYNHCWATWIYRKVLKF